MLIAIKGRAPYNNYRVENYYEGYKKQFIMKFPTSNDFFKWEETAVRPLLGGKYLVEITETKWVRDLNGLVNKLEGFSEHPYIDIVWYPEEARLESITTVIELLDLRKYYKEDLFYNASKTFGYTDEEVLQHLLKKINYRWNLYELYRDILLDKFGETLTKNNIDTVIETESIKSAHEILTAVVFKQRFAINNYYKLRKRYSNKWVKGYFSKEIDRIIDYKIKIANRDKTYSDIKKDKKVSKYIFIITKVPIANLQILRLLVNEPLGVEIWLNNSPIDIYKNVLGLVKD